MLRRILGGHSCGGVLFDWHFVEVMRRMMLKDYLRCRAAWSRKKTQAQAKTQHKRRVRQGSRPKEQRGSD
nr:MAG TPA: Prolyl oligopeptidase family [Caudoviricetes sp.]